MIRTRLPVLFYSLILCCVGTPVATHAMTADDVNCNKCVGNKDLGNKAVTDKKIKNKAVSNKKIKKDTIQSSRIKDQTLQKQDLSDALIEDLGAGFLKIVDSNGAVVGPHVSFLSLGGVLLNIGTANKGHLFIGRNGIYSWSTIYYSLPGCQGTPYLDGHSPPELIYELLGVGPDPNNGQLAAFASKDPNIPAAPTAVGSKAEGVTGSSGNIVYVCNDTPPPNPTVVEGKSVLDISDLNNPPFTVQDGQ